MEKHIHLHQELIGSGLESANNKEYRTSLITNKFSKYVELLPDNQSDEKNKGMAISETVYVKCASKKRFYYKWKLLFLGI